MANKEEYAAGYVKEADSVFQTPLNNIFCKNCSFRKRVVVNGKEHLLGYGNKYCGKYDKTTDGKPFGILFSGERCKFYKKQ